MSSLTERGHQLDLVEWEMDESVELAQMYCVLRSLIESEVARGVNP